MLKAYLDLTKSGITIFVLVCGVIGYALGSPYGAPFVFEDITTFIIGLYLLSSGSLAFNQAQEWTIDKKMKRTETRPIPSGLIQPWQAYCLGIVFCIVGTLILFIHGVLPAALGVLTVVLYNGLYTLYWKKRWSFGAVPGAIPGAMPVSIGFACQNTNLLDSLHIYLFLIVFLWQMPHFWILAIKFKNDYLAGGFPVLPLKIGVERTVYHIGLYMFAYLAVAITAPITIGARWVHFLVILPFVIMVLYYFFQFVRHGEKKWLGFFLSVNFSMLAFISAPVFDRVYKLLTL